VKKFRYLMLGGVGLFVLFCMFSVHPEVTEQEGFPAYSRHLINDGNGVFHLAAKYGLKLAANQAEAQIIPTAGGAPAGSGPTLAGGPVGGIGQVALPGQVSGQASITGQSTLIQVPAAGYSPLVYSKCMVSIASPLPPAANDQVGCVVTSTATVTVIASATVTQTVGAINIQAAGTPTAKVNWLLVK